MKEYIEYLNPSLEELKEGEGKIVRFYFNWRRKTSSPKIVIGRLEKAEENKEGTGVHGYHLHFSTLFFGFIKNDDAKRKLENIEKNTGTDYSRISRDCHYWRFPLDQITEIDIFK